MVEYVGFDKHPSWGMLKISRVTGHTPLFGSSVVHDHFIQVTITEGMRKFDYGHDVYHSPLMPKIEVWMSAAQFAEAITSFNIGCGVPCTIRSFNGKDIERPPNEFSEAKRLKDHVTKRLKEETANFEPDVKKIHTILEKNSIGKGDREEIKKTLEHLVCGIKNMLPFYVEQFEDATERITTKAKTELDSMLSHHLINKGLKEIQRERESILLEDTK